jgi:hypothetical protein
MKRKLVIPMVVLCMGLIALALALLMAEPPPARVAYDGISKSDAGQVWFLIHSAVTNRASFDFHQEQRIEGRWRVVQGPASGYVYTREGETFGILQAVPPGDHVWRAVVEYRMSEERTFQVRAREQLLAIAKQLRWRKLILWLAVRKPTILYGPEMLGNQPVEKI